MFLLECCEFSSVSCLVGEKNLDDSLRLDVVEIMQRLTCFHSASVTRKDLQFGT
jgi:hypothetical protein